MSPAYPNPLPKMVEVLDAAIRADLESLRYEYFIGLLICTGAVFGGLVCEVGEIWHEVTGFFKRRQFTQEYESTPALREPSHRVKMWTAVGWLLIVIGVGGEGVFDGLVSWADSTLQTFNNILLEATQKEAGSAAQSAKTAREESTTAKTEADAAKLSAGEALIRAHAAERSLAKAEDDAGKAQTAAANALTTATDAVARAGKAEASLGRAEAEAKSAEASASNALTLAREARKEAASFESDLTRLKQQAADRVLDEYQQEEVRLRVMTFLGTPYELAVADTPEAEKLLIEIDAAVDSAGWLYKASESKAFRFTKKLRNGKAVEQITLRGVEIGATPALLAKLKPAADALAKALNSEGISALAVKLPEDDPSPNNIHIMVGSKP